jgi:TPR repeat protein
MAFFKTARDQIKVEAFVSHLEGAKARIAPGLSETARYLKWAQKAMERVKEAKAEYFFSKKAWMYVIELCEELAQVVRNGGEKDLLVICRSIYEWALENQNRPGGGGVLSAVDSVLERMNEGEIVSALEVAALNSDADSQFDLALMFTKGDGVAVNEKKAAYWFEQAASKGHPLAQHNFGLLCLDGMGTPKDEAKAIEWFEKAASQGVVNAYLNLGRIYEFGQGVSKNDERAAAAYKEAAALGSRNAQFNLGVMYANGRGVPKSERKAVDFYQSAAAQGYASAHHNLGWMYQLGQGVPRDQVQAYARFTVAVSLGHKGASENVADLECVLTRPMRIEGEKLAKRILDNIKTPGQ